jgi:putative PIN family toxin of toxin-antitoxin system
VKLPVSGMEVGTNLRVFLDSNVIVSGLYSSQRAPGKIIEYFIAGRIKVVVSRQVLEEIVRVIRQKLPEALPALNTLLINTPPEIVKDPPASDMERWAKVVHIEDASILAAAVSAHPDYLVTGDNHFFNNVNQKDTGLAIISPSELLKLLDKDS